ncbi:MAG: YihY family inner membrane protein [Legionellaceae bacterium]|nr:YihY family inner membrane protein [Legionellaceae bacterium]
MTQKIIATLYQFVVFTFKNYIRNDCGHRASTLTLTTVLSMVPLLIVFFSLLTFLPYFDQILKPLQNFIFNHFVPESGRAVQEYILNFTAKASQFSIMSGFAVLLYSMILIYNIELALNKIWHVNYTRKPLNGLIVYLAILIIFPLFLGVSLLLSSYIRSISFLGPEYQIQKNILISYAPFLLAWIGFTFLYYIVPNKRIKFSQALLSAALATVFFEIAKQGFSLYLSYVTLYEVIYGVFAIIPVFIIWIYLVWILTLFCAEINYSLAVVSKKHLSFFV